MSSDGGSNQSVERSARVLAVFAEGAIGRELRVADVAKQADLGVSTTSRLLATLEKVGYVQRDAATQLYSLGPMLVTLGVTALNAHPVLRASRQVAQDLAARTGFGANVAVRDGDAIYYLCNFEGHRAPRSFALAGQRNPLAATGLGKCFLGDMSPDERRELLGDDLRTYTANTKADHQALDLACDELNRRGYTTEVEELALGRACIAAPVRDRSGQVVAAMSVSGPLTSLDLATREAELAAILIEAADQVSVQLGYSPHGGSRVTA